jgi:hypothetical protein
MTGMVVALVARAADVSFASPGAGRSGGDSPPVPGICHVGKVEIGVVWPLRPTVRRAPGFKLDDPGLERPTGE